MGRKDDIIMKRIKQEGVVNFECELSHERTLKTMASSANFNKDLFDKGQKWFESGLSLEDAPEEIKTNRDFIRGFERGRRLVFIEELDKNIKGKSK